LWCAGALVLSVLKFLHRQWVPGLLLVVIGVAAILIAASYPRTLRGQEIPLEAADSGDRIVMRLSIEALAKWLAWAAGFLIAAVMLVQFPDILWTKWLSYPAACGALLPFGLLLGVALRHDLERVVADASGIEVRGDPDLDGASDTKVAWAQVGAVKRVRVYVRKGSRGTGGDNLVRCEFVLLDRGGAELLNLEDPLDPPEKYARFLESIPRWTGLPVQNERVTK
jgi:hypothetical protein